MAAQAHHHDLDLEASRIMTLAAIPGDSVLFPDEVRPVLVPIDAKPKEQNVSN